MEYKKGILVTTYRGREDDCAQEAWYIFSELNYRDFLVEKPGLPGIIILRVNFNPVDAVESLINYSKENVWRIRYILKAIPLEIITSSDYEEIANSVEVLSKKIEENKTFRITVNNRNSPLSSQQLIKVCAERVNRKVDLKNFDYQVLIEIVGQIAGVSVLKRNQIFSLHKAREEGIKSISDIKPY